MQAFVLTHAVPEENNPGMVTITAQVEKAITASGVLYIFYISHKMSLHQTASDT